MLRNNTIDKSQSHIPPIATRPTTSTITQYMVHNTADMRITLVISCGNRRLTAECPCLTLEGVFPYFPFIGAGFFPRYTEQKTGDSFQAHQISYAPTRYIAIISTSISHRALSIYYPPYCYAMRVSLSPRVPSLCCM